MTTPYPMPEKYRFTPQKLLERIYQVHVENKTVKAIPDFSANLFRDLSAIAARDADNLRETLVRWDTDPDYQAGDYPGSVLHLISLLPGFGLAAHLGEAAITVYLNELFNHYFWTGKTEYIKHVLGFRKRWKHYVQRIVAEILAMVRSQQQLPYKLNASELYSRAKLPDDLKKYQAELAKWAHPDDSAEWGSTKEEEGDEDGWVVF
jgi:hypothetical protein